MELLHAILAAVFGTALMSRSSFTEMFWEGRPASVVPGQAVNKVLSPFGVPKIEGRLLHILSDYAHWALGTSWGVVFWLLLDVAGLNLGLTGILYFFIVWGAEQVYLPLLGIGVPWSWRWGTNPGGRYVWKYNLSDMWHHVVYAGGTTLGWLLIDFTQRG